MVTKLSALFNRYLEVSKIAYSTCVIKKRAAGFFVKLFGDIDVAEISVEQADDYASWLARRMKGKAVNTYFASFKPFFVWCMARGYIARNPFGLVRRLPEAEIIRDIYTAEEVERMLEVADLRWRGMILLGLCSLRRGEILNLTVSDIDFEKSYIYIRPKKQTQTTWSWDIKNHNQAITPMPTDINLGGTTVNLHNILCRLIEDLPVGQPYVFVKPSYYQILIKRQNDGILSEEHKGRPWANFTRDFKNLLRRASVDYRGFHNLRSTFGTNMAKAGMSVKETQCLMRHSSASTTLRYYIKVDSQKIVSDANEKLKNFMVPNVR